MSPCFQVVINRGIVNNFPKHFGARFRSFKNAAGQNLPTNKGYKLGLMGTRSSVFKISQSRVFTFRCWGNALRMVVSVWFQCPTTGSQEAKELANKEKGKYLGSLKGASDWVIQRKDK